jgi:S1-C subfamily serine protease
MAGRRVRRGWLGLSLQPVDPLMAARLGLDQPGGAIVNVSAEESPAWKAGIRRGDVIISCDGDPVETNADLLYKTYSRRPGDEVELVYLRRGARRTVKVALGERGAEAASRAAPAAAAARPASGPGLDWEGVTFVYDGGAAVSAVDGESRLAGYLRQGDLVKAVNGAAIDSKEAMERAFARASLAEGVVFDLQRDGQSTYLSVQSR